jgi:nucleoside-diphosphate-sugar epimerase
MSRVLVTGANGFIGSHLVRKFISEGHDVSGLVRTTSDLSLIDNTNLSLVYGDITDRSSLAKSLEGADILIHNAGLASDWGSLAAFRQVNVEGTKNVAKVAAECGVRRIVYMSTAAVHGFNHTAPVCENDPVNPVFNYSISKLEAENWLFSFAKKTDIEVSAVRPGNVFGPDDHTFIRKYIDGMLTGRIAYVNGGRSFTCPTYVGNLVDAVYLAAFHRKAAGEVFIVTDGLEITWKQFTETIAEKLGIRGPGISIPLGIGLAAAFFAENLYRLSGIKHAPLITKYRMYNAGTNYHFSINKAEKVLGFSPGTGFEEAVDKTVSWYLQEHNRK